MYLVEFIDLEFKQYIQNDFLTNKTHFVMLVFS